MYIPPYGNAQQCQDLNTWRGSGGFGCDYANEHGRPVLSGEQDVTFQQQGHL